MKILLGVQSKHQRLLYNILQYTDSSRSDLHRLPLCEDEKGKHIVHHRLIVCMLSSLSSRRATHTRDHRIGHTLRFVLFPPSHRLIRLIVIRADHPSIID